MSTRSLGSLTLDLIMKTGLFEQGMDRAARTADKRMKEIERSAKIAGAAFGGALVAGISLVIRNTMQAEKNLAQLDAILESTGNAAGYTRGELIKMAAELQKGSTFGSNEIIEAQTRLLSYSGILGENIPRAMQTVIDQSARLGMSLSQSAETIGRALESPSKAAAALAQQGFGAAFTEEVRIMIDALVAAGREADAQVMILDILAESYGGAGKAARDTLGGALTALKHTLSDVMTGSDGSLDGMTQSVNDLIDALNDPQVRQGFADIVNGLLSISNEIVKAIPKISEFGRQFGGMVRQMGIDAGFLMEAATAAAQGYKQIFSLGIADGTYKEADDRWKRAFQTRREMMAENQRDIARASANAKALAGLANLSYVQHDGPLLEGMPVPGQVRTEGLDLRTKEEKAAAAKAAKDRQREADQTQRIYESAMDSAKERLALMGVESELARSLYQLHEGSLKALSPQRKAELEQIYQQIDARQMLNDALAKEEKAREKERKRVEDAMKAGKELLADLQFELELMRLTNAERATAIQLRGLDAEAVAEYGERIAAANKQIEDSMRQIELMDGFRDSFSNFFQDVIGGTKSVKDAFTDMLDNINRMIMQRVADNWVEKLFGSFGTSQSGSAGGGWMSTFASWFGGGKAGGGWAHANSVYEVNERGMEMATVNGRDYLLTGNKSVKITPNHQVGGGGQMITNNMTVQGRIDRRSEQRIARDIAQKTRVATARA